MLMPCLAGCRNVFDRQGPPQDPLFLSRTPTAAKTTSAPPVVIACLEPAAPRNPFAGDSNTAIADNNSGSVPGTLMHRSNAKD
jgi:hypothetical protein